MIKNPDEFRNYALSHVKDGYIPVYGDFNDELAEIIIDCIQEAHQKGKEKMTFLIDSNGGWTDSCNAIIARMLHTQIEFTGLVMGKARSNGLRLLMHCKHRQAYRGSALLFHWGSFFAN